MPHVPAYTRTRRKKLANKKKHVNNVRVQRVIVAAYGFTCRSIRTSPYLHAAAYDVHAATYRPRQT